MINHKCLFNKQFVKKKDFTNNYNNSGKFCSFQSNLINIIETAKQRIFPKIASKLWDPNISSKNY